MKKRTKTVVTVVLVLALGAVIAAPQLLPKPPMGPPSAVASTFSVKTETVKSGSLVEYLELNGDVITETNVDIYSEVGGKLTDVAVRVGDSVVKGRTVVAVVDPSKPGASYALSQVYSPLTGTVTSLSAQVGATIGTQTSLGTVGVLQGLEVESRVPEVNVAAVKEGLRAQVSFEAFPGRVFNAQVSRVSPVVDVASRSKSIRLKFTGDASEVNLGMFGRVKLFLGTREARVQGPLSAVIHRLGKDFVFVVEGGKALKREVVVGSSVDGVVEFVSGLDAGDALVVKGQELLDDGAAVKVVP